MPSFCCLFITICNCRTASKGQGIRDPLRSHSNNEYIEQDRQEKLIEDKIKPLLNNFVGFAYEEIALEYLKTDPQFSDYIFGCWWDKEEEIDILGLDNSRNRIIFGEVKWRDLSEKDARQVLNRLVEKSVNVKWGNNPEKKYLLIGKKVGGKKG